MKKVFIHGIGQSNAAWDEMKPHILGEAKYLNLLNFDEESDDIYQELYNMLCKECNKEDGDVHLCGISLGGVMAMQYAIDFPQKVKSLILINTPYKIPVLLLKLQKLIFQCTPSIFFNKGFSKKNSIKLISRIIEKNSWEEIKNIKAKILIIYGDKDKINKKFAIRLFKETLNSKIVKIENANHEINVEQPMKLLEEINIFWEEIKDYGNRNIINK
ncbi:alpha/beta fold hydrolase [Streptobacillus canis]|uniref:alpha/beta fold hydrolase n=1 Tax=Streptobacillus canis TaxID=2678686 RepID=UPI0012E20446|nr:alpha/beta fold hydrolase [Streptobacillus canis]